MIRIRDSLDPLSDEGLRDDDNVILARSESLDLLRDDLRRYCDSKIQGRSFLIAGHRGAGKTTLVANAVREIRSHSLETKAMRPLPVFLHGPSLLRTWPTDYARDPVSLASRNGNGHGGNAAAPPSPEPTSPPEPAPDPDPVTKRDAAAQASSTEEEKRTQNALVHIILGIHRAVSREFVDHYRRSVLVRQESRTVLSENQIARIEQEFGELAAQFEIELLEDPPASRLREFWERANALERGVLFTTPRVADQGARELTAINGICNAHQRISGALSGEEKEKRKHSLQQELVSGFTVKAADALKPLGAVLAGAVVTGGTAIGSNQLWVPALLGLATSWLSARFLKSTLTQTSRRERTLDRNFIPDLTIRTLDRIIPFLVDRLRAAGLAPVFVIDELDKVERLGDCFDELAAYLKKLVADNVFSCFLADRSYLEFVRQGRDEKDFGRAFSLFSHRLVVSYCPWDFDDYLSRIFDLDQSATASAQERGGARADLDVLKWVLRHRSQMHALKLQREVASLARNGESLMLDPGAIRTDFPYRIDLTLQMAVELTFYSAEAVGWLERQPLMLPALYDALYYLSRSWLDGDSAVDLSKKGKEAMIESLIERMRLSEATDLYAGDEEAKRKALGADDRILLGGFLESMVRFLGPDNTQEKTFEQWSQTIARLKWKADAMPLPAVMEALLLKDESLLLAPRKPRTSAKGGSRPASPASTFEWRYLKSGLPRKDMAAQQVRTTAIPNSVINAIEEIAKIESTLRLLLAESDDPGGSDVFGQLSDRWRVLPTTPAWPQVKAAIANLKAVQSGTGNIASVQKDCRNIRDFRRNLRECEETVLKVLWCARWLDVLGESR